MSQKVSDTPPPIVLVLCTGNSCRSQMAEVILNHDLAGRVFALSAGTLPQPHVAPNALEALRQIGLATEGLRPKHVDEMLDAPVDLVVTVCDGAAEACPVFPRPVRKIHVPFPDPHAAPLDAFIAVRDAIREQLPARVCQTLGLPAPDVIHR